MDIADFDYPERDRIKIIQGDIRDKAAVEKAMQGINWVIHTAAALPLYTEEEILSIDVDGTRNLLQAADAVKVDRFVHISALLQFMASRTTTHYLRMTVLRGLGRMG